MINAYTLVPLIMSGENVGVELGPYNTKYSGLAQHLIDTGFHFHAESPGAWSAFLNLDSDKGARERRTRDSGAMRCQTD